METKTKVQTWPAKLTVRSEADLKYPDLFTNYIEGRYVDNDGGVHGDNCVYAVIDGNLPFAQLLASAPDLLAALEDIVAHFENSKAALPEHKVFTNARAAIAQARGEG